MDNWPETSESLILRLNDAQDAAAWNDFLAIYRPVVIRMARRRGLQRADADDLTQRVFMSVARKVGSWQPCTAEARFRTWLGRIARNAILNELTRGKPDRAVGGGRDDALINQVPDRNELSSVLLLETHRQSMALAMSAVKPEFSTTTWKMFFQTAIEQRSVKETAEQFGRSSGAVYIARCRVMQRIREHLQNLSDFWSDES